MLRNRWLGRLTIFAAGLAAGAAVLALLRPAIRVAPTASAAGVAAATGLSEAERAMERPVPEVWMEGVPLDEAVDRLRPAAGVPIDVDWRALDLEDVDRKTPVTVRCRNLPLRDVLTRALDGAFVPSGMVGAQADGERVLISTGEVLSQRRVLRVYDVRDLAPPGRLVPGRPVQGLLAPGGAPVDDTPLGDSLVELIRDTVDPESWRESGGSAGAIRHFGGRLAVVQVPSNHRAIRDLLDQLRHPPPAPPARPPDGPAVAPDARGVAERWEARLRRWVSVDPAVAATALRRTAPEFTIDVESLERAVERLAQLSGEPILVDREAIDADAAGAGGRIVVHVRDRTLAQALRTVLDASNRGPLSWWCDGGVITVTTRAEAEKHLVTAAYDISDYLRAAGTPVPTNAVEAAARSAARDGGAYGDAVDRLKNSIQVAVAHESWRDRFGSVGTMEELGGRLFVTQTWENQERVRRFIEAYLAVPPAPHGDWNLGAAPPTSQPASGAIVRPPPGQ